MTAYCDFFEQEQVAAENGRLRPDMVVRQPAGREIVVDCKVPLDGYMEALDAASDEARRAALLRHAAQVRQHVRRLAAKEYWKPFAGTLDFVVLFIPNDSFFAAAAEQDPALLETALQQKVVIVTPMTFIALLRAIEYGWKQEQIAENAERISALGQELFDRMATLGEHIGRIGGSLDKAVEAYNQAVRSLESRVLPSARKFKALGAGGRKAIEALEPIEHAVRQLGQPDLPELAADEE
jgi:DNA recombination protein RmuC